MSFNEHQIAPTGDRVFVKDAGHIRQHGLLFVVGGKNDDLAISQVISRGPEVRLKPWELAPGDHILHARVSGVTYVPPVFEGGARTNSRRDETNYKFLRENEIIGVVAPELVGKIVGNLQFSEGRMGTCDVSKV